MLCGEKLGPTTQQIFSEIYRKNGWRGTESASGTGSTLEQTAEIRKRIPELLQRHRVESLLDIPCGDFHWFRQMPVVGVDYIGADIVAALVESNREKNGGDFRELDMTADPLPRVDLIFTRDCFVHFSYGLIFAAIENMRSSGSRFLLTTTFPGRDNQDIETGGWRPLDLAAFPFNLSPVEVINEKCSQHGGLFSDKSLGLFKLN
jgi:SAM-dependent methyltransferase